MNRNFMQKAGFAKEVERVEQRRCPICNKKINAETEFQDELSLKEFQISGMC